MADKTIKYLKEDRGRWFYRRRIPLNHQKTLGRKMWTRPCGDVTYQKAVALVTEWSEKDDELIAKLEGDHKFASELRRYNEESQMWTHADSLVELVHVSQTDPDRLTEVPISADNPLIQGMDTFEPLTLAIASIQSVEASKELDRQDQLIRYKSILKASFGSHVDVPTDADKRDEFDLVKRKLERRIALIQGSPNTISAVAERYYDFSGITDPVRNKYRRTIKALIKQVGDIPLHHLTAAKLREFRDVQSVNMQSTSLWSLFTPIRGIFGYAVSNEIIDLNPMPSVPMPKEKRSIQMRKWQPFTPNEAQRIFQAMEKHWGSPVQGMTEERRLANHMVVRVLAFTSMRPREALTLKPENVTNKWIKVIGSKTEGSDRTIPLHPQISDFPAFYHAGGFDTFKSQKKDRAQTVRHNFAKLIREKMDPPILDKKKVLYSWRSTFSNAMRRAGADAEMRRAILGHAEAGALKHYDDGPEFAKKRKWIRASDPRTEYPDAEEDDELD